MMNPPTTQQVGWETQQMRLRENRTDGLRAMTWGWRALTLSAKRKCVGSAGISARRTMKENG